MLASINTTGYNLWYIMSNILGTLESLVASIIDSKSAELPLMLHEPRNS